MKLCDFIKVISFFFIAINGIVNVILCSMSSIYGFGSDPCEVFPPSKYSCVTNRWWKVNSALTRESSQFTNYCQRQEAQTVHEDLRSFLSEFCFVFSWMDFPT